MKKFCSTIISICCLLLVVSYPLKAQYADLLNFNDFNGIYPQGDLLLSGNLLYGMTSYGGANNYGCIFSIFNNGNLYTDLHDFNDTNGAIPYGSLTLSGGLLFGMTWTGGTHDSGCIFSMHTNGNDYKILHYFTNTNGVYPRGNLTLSGNILYGMASGGGQYDSGCIFSIDTNGSRYKDIHDFRDTNGYPYGSLTLSGGKLYGMTSHGKYDSLILSHTPHDSLIYDSGCIFSIDTSGSNYKVIYNFEGINGAYPWGSLLLWKDKLYGMTSIGTPHNQGCVFSIDTGGHTYLILCYFTGANGAYPHGSLVHGATDLLYGMTGRGGANDSGCIFSIDTSGARYKDLLDFNSTKGTNPFGSLIISGKILYGMTEYGGANNIGLIFKLDTNNNNSASIDNLPLTTSLINIYPNPNNGHFTIELKSDEVVSGPRVLYIYNILGEQIYSLPVAIGNNSPISVDLPSQPNGIYLYRVISETAELVGEGKIIIQK